MAYNEEDYLQLSGLQHFSFCRRQWALIHLEQQWAENLLTVQGNILHEKAHDGDIRELRGDVLTTRGMKIHSPTLGVSGECDVVEFRRSADGVPLSGRGNTNSFKSWTRTRTLCVFITWGISIKPKSSTSARKSLMRPRVF